MMSEKQLREKVFGLRRELQICEEILNSKREGFGRPKGSIKYTQEQGKFLKENKNIPMKKLIELYNKKFGTNFHKDSRALYNFMDRQGLFFT
jgi:hypothetical protein